MMQLGSYLGTMVTLDTWTDAELDEATRVGPATEQDREAIRKTIRFLQRLSESMQRTLEQRIGAAS
jgi:hypothetical protein